MFKNLPDNVRIALSAFLPMLAILILSYIVGSFGLSKISTLNKSITKAEKDKVVLTQKLSILRGLQPSTLQGASVAVVALPESNPSIITVSQIKALAVRNGVIISNIKSGGEVSDPSGLSRVDINFDITGTRSDVVKTILDVPTLAPITLVDKAKLNETNQNVRASINVKSFWAPLPTQLPALTEQIVDLTDKERESLTILETLTMPEFGAVVAADGVGKTDPFIQ